MNAADNVVTTVAEIAKGKEVVFQKDGELLTIRAGAVSNEQYHNPRTGLKTYIKSWVGSESLATAITRVAYLAQRAFK